MGLDMYLSRRHYVQRWDHIPADKQFNVTVTRGGEPYTPIKPERVSYVVEHVAYWRKANAIHQWFVANVQNGVDDCRDYELTADQLRELLNATTAALKAYRTPGGKPADFLPTQGGFFFGSTAYDKDYKQDLLDTLRQLEPLLKEDGTDGAGSAYYVYSASW